MVTRQHTQRCDRPYQQIRRRQDEIVIQVIRRSQISYAVTGFVDEVQKNNSPLQDVLQQKTKILDEMCRAGLMAVQKGR
jgi:hypothetical protein